MTMMSEHTFESAVAYAARARFDERTRALRRRLTQGGWSPPPDTPVEERFGEPCLLTPPGAGGRRFVLALNPHGGGEQQLYIRALCPRCGTESNGILSPDLAGVADFVSRASGLPCPAMYGLTNERMPCRVRGDQETE